MGKRETCSAFSPPGGAFSPSRMLPVTLLSDQSGMSAISVATVATAFVYWWIVLGFFFVDIFVILVYSRIPRAFAHLREIKWEKIRSLDGKGRSMIWRYHWLVQQRGRREAVVRAGCKKEAECMDACGSKTTHEQREKFSKHAFKYCTAENEKIR